MQRLPQLRLLVTFDEVARLGSMREAAARLNVSRPAVSQALHRLEDHLGAVLFDRSRRPAKLTADGHRLAAATREGLGQIAEAIDEIRERNHAIDTQVTVACTLGMATYWLMPRLPEFYARHPEITVNVQASPDDLPTISHGIDIALRYGTGSWNDGQTSKLFDERVCPAGTPELVARLLASGQELSSAPLIHVRNVENRHWAGWAEYLKKRGFERSKGPGQIFDNYVQATQAALDGRGLILGWRSLVSALVGDDKLAAWPDGEIDFGTSYFVTLAGTHSSASALFAEWLLSSASSLSGRTDEGAGPPRR